MQEQSADYLQTLPGSDVIKAFKKGGPAPHHLTSEMINLPHEPLTEETEISIEKSYGNDIS